MSRHAVSAFGLLALLAAFAPSLTAQKGTPEPRAGLEFKPPKGWIELPADGDRHATLRLFASPRALAAAKGEATHSPLLRVMFFQKGGDASKDVVDTLPRQTPYRSLEDYFKRGLGAKDVSQEAAKVGGVEGQRVTGKGLTNDRVVFGQTLPLADGEAAVCFEVASSQLEKLKKELDGVLGSLAAIPRVATPRFDPPWVTDADWAKKDAAARSTARRKWADELVAATAKAPESSFKVSKSKYWTVLSAADPGFTKKAVAAAEAFREWLAKKQPELTKDEPPAVLRIFESPDNFAAYLTTVVDNRDYDRNKRELYFLNDRDNGGNTGYGMLFRAIVWQMFDDVDPGVLPAMPRWFDNGCWEFLRSSKYDGKKLEFMPSDVEKGRIDYQQRAKTMPALWDLMQEHIQVSPTDGTNEKEWGYTPECARLMRWLWMNDGLKAFEKPNLVADYLRALGAAHAKLGADPTADAAVIGLTETEQKEINRRHYKWRDAMLVATNDVAVPLQVDVWKAVNEKWLEFNKNYK